MMKLLFAKARLVLGVLLLLGWGALATPAVAQQSFSERSVRSLVEGLQNGTLRPSLATAQCAAELDDDPDRDDIREVMTTYLEVPAETAVAAFCNAFTLAIKAGDISLDALLPIIRQQKDANGFFQFGRLLRVIYLTHRQSTTASLEGLNLR